MLYLLTNNFFRQVQKGKCRKVSVTFSGRCHLWEEDNRRMPCFPPRENELRCIVTTRESFLTFILELILIFSMGKKFRYVRSKQFLVLSLNLQSQMIILETKESIC